MHWGYLVFTVTLPMCVRRRRESNPVTHSQHLTQPQSYPVWVSDDVPDSDTDSQSLSRLRHPMDTGRS